MIKFHTPFNSYFIGGVDTIELPFNSNSSYRKSVRIVSKKSKKSKKN